MTPVGMGIFFPFFLIFFIHFFEFLCKIKVWEEIFKNLGGPSD